MNRFILFICIILNGCKVTNYPLTAEVTFISSTSPGLVTIESIGYGANENLAEINAYTSAFRNILFKGLPDFLPLKRPLVDNEENAKANHPAYFNFFFEERGYMQFVTKQNSITHLGKADDKKNKSVKRSFVVNFESLRKDLEKNGVIKKFGL